MSPFRKKRGLHMPPVFATQSTHKMLFAFSQGSMLHFRQGTGKNKLDPRGLIEANMMHASTSPFYPIFASLDVSARIMKDNGYTTGMFGKWAGGGIMPDYFVPVDTTQYTVYHQNIAAKGVILKTTMKFIENNRKSLLAKYNKFETYEKDFTISEDILKEMREMADKEKITFDEKQYQQSLPLIKAQLKALIARDLWDMTEYFRVINQSNPSVQRALEILSSTEYENILKSGKRL
jgi:hypothetical protein